MDAATALRLHLAANLYMVGVIWFVQLVHYPLMALIPVEQGTTYATQHQRRTTWVVMPCMLLEVATAIWLGTFFPPYRTGPFAGAGLLLAIIWLSTFFVQVPQHRRLLASHDQRIVERLVAANWIRTISWTAKAVLVSIVAFNG